MKSIDTPTQYAFTLGREWKLSLAELLHVFRYEQLIGYSEEVALFEGEFSDEEIRSIFSRLGGSIRAIRIVKSGIDEKKFPIAVIEEIKRRQKSHEGGKVDFALGSYGREFPLSDIGLRIKKTLKENGISSRIINTKNENINAAAWKGGKLGKSQTEYNLIQIPLISAHERISRESQEYSSYLGVTLSCQDIDAYARRDTGKSRNMIVGMMPPKLVQMMINIADLGSKSVIYDPFCGLGTTLIEAANMGYTHIRGSDISKEMVEASKKSIVSYIQEEKMWQDRIRKAGGIPSRDAEKIEWDIWHMDAEEVGKKEYLKEISGKEEKSLVIVSEGYLGEIMSVRDISLERVKNERAKLAKMYERFFSGLESISKNSHKESSPSGVSSLVMSFPFWNIHGTYSYFTEIYDIIDKSGFQVVPLLPTHMKLNTMKGSLLYRRDQQSVGREIIKIIKK